MLLKNHVEAACLIINNAAQGPFVIDELTGELMNKVNIEHFVILHSMNPDELNKDICSPPKKKRKKKSNEEFDALDAKGKKEYIEKEADQRLAEQAAYEEVDEDEELGRGEESISISEEAELRYIARSRKINQPSLTVLTDNGWFLCPVYKGMTELRPMVLQQLDRKKGYRVIISKKVIMQFGPVVPFREDNYKDWEINSMFILNQMFDNTPNPYKLHAESIFIHKRIDIHTHDLKSAISRYETTQRTRIKLSNTLVDEVLIHVGQERFTDNKEKLAILDGKKKEKENLTKNDTDDVKIIAHITNAYNRINEKAEELGKKVPINLESTFNNIIKEVAKDDEELHKKEAEEWVELKKLEAEKDPSVTVPDYDEAYDLTNILRTKDLITSFVTYLNVKVYVNAYANETDAKKVVVKLAQEDDLWEFAKGITGFGEIPFAYIQANINWRLATHPSAVIRYLGLDNVVDVPKREDGSTMTDDEAREYIDFIINDVARKVNQEREGAEITRENFSWEYKTDALETYDEYMFSKDFCMNEFEGLTYDGIREKLKTMDLAEIDDKYPDFADYLVSLWSRISIEYHQINGVVVPVVKKRARAKKDTVISSYIDKNGKVKFKKSLGYNAKIKSRLIEIAFGQIMKSKNEYYYGTLYKNKKQFYLQRAEDAGDVPKNINMVAHMRARRYAVQILIEEFWKYARTYYGLPLNGGTYYEAKLHGSHGHGFDPAQH